MTELQRSVAVAAEEKRARVTTLKTLQREVRQQLMTKQREKTRVVLVIIFFMYLFTYLLICLCIDLFILQIGISKKYDLFILDNKKTELLLLDYFVILSPLF